MSSRMAAMALLLTAVLGGGAWLVLGDRSRTEVQRDQPKAPMGASLDLGKILGGEVPEGYQRVIGPRELIFPEDHGPHPDFRSEWWYFTGNLETQEGRPFGYQLTIFRSALAPGAPRRDSAWATHQMYMGHFALSDLEGGSFHAFQRLARGAVGLGGARAEPFEVWVGPWRMESAGETFWPLHVQAGEAMAIDLLVEPEKERVLQGDRGYSRKGEERGNASHYYSYTRLGTRGTVRIDGQELKVAGSSWLDREWSTSALGSQQVGWDWFALQLEDGSELMLYSLRRSDGRVDPASAGTLVMTDGNVRKLHSGEFSIAVLEHWRSPDGAAVYPSRWTLSVPSEDLELTVRPRQADQELLLAVRYWEGSVEVEGTKKGREVSGVGYVELTGYAGRS